MGIMGNADQARRGVQFRSASRVPQSLISGLATTVVNLLLKPPARPPANLREVSSARTLLPAVVAVTAHPCPGTMTDATADAAAAPQQQQLLYHEAQESRLCAVHCINAVLQGPYYSEIDLAALANQLDEQEQRVMLESGLGLHSPAYLSFMAEGSANVAADGNFSIQVLKSALQVWNLQCVSLESPEAQEARNQPHLQGAFICHLQAHWFTIRRVASEWYNFNSLYPAPEHLSPFYLAAFLDTLKGDGWSIFVVLGQLPGQFPGGTAEGSGGSFGRWLTPDQAQQIVAAAKAAQEREQQERAREQQVGRHVQPAEDADPQLAAAIAASLRVASGPVSERQDETSGYSAAQVQEDQELAAAIAASLSSSLTPRAAADAPVLHPDAAALAQALAESFYSAGSSYLRRAER